MLIRFGACTLDSERREVRRDGEIVHLSPKAFELLRLLAEGRPRAFAKNELFERLWPGTFVADASLAGLVAEVRRGIGEDAREPRHLRTVHGFGYAFSDGRGDRADEAGVFRLVCGAREIALGLGENVLGREAGSALVIDDATVSRHHARIVITGERAALEDLGSKNGTWLRGRRLTASEILSDGDELRIGSVPLIFRRFAPGSATRTQRE